MYDSFAEHRLRDLKPILLGYDVTSVSVLIRVSSIFGPKNVMNMGIPIPLLLECQPCFRFLHFCFIVLYPGHEGLTLRPHPPKPAIFLTNGSWLLDTRMNTRKNKKFFHILLCKGIIERWRRGGKGHHVSGDTAGTWCQNRRFR